MNIGLISIAIIFVVLIRLGYSEWSEQLYFLLQKDFQARTPPAELLPVLSPEERLLATQLFHSVRENLHSLLLENGRNPRQLSSAEGESALRRVLGNRVNDPQHLHRIYQNLNERRTNDETFLSVSRMIDEGRGDHL